MKTKRGFARLEWQKLRERNEALDARVYARAAAWIAGLDRWSEERWAEAEREVSVETRPAAAVATDGGLEPARPTAGSAAGAVGSTGRDSGTRAGGRTLDHAVATIRRHR